MSSSFSRSAFAFFIALPPPRSLEVVARALDVSLERVERTAKKNRWLERADEIELYAQWHAAGGFRGRKLKGRQRRLLAMAKQIQRLGLQSLRRFPLVTALELVEHEAASERRNRRYRGSGLSVEQIQGCNNEVLALLLADRRRHGTPALGEERLL